jgi:hypothetical protein
MHRGDINVNGAPCEAADAVMFANYFTRGLQAFPQHPTYGPQLSVEASDVNRDGVPLGLADLQLLIRIIAGDFEPAYPPLGTWSKFAPAEVELVRRDDVMSVDAEVGAAHLVMAGEVEPVLLVDLEMRCAFDGMNTRILIYDPSGRAGFSGEFVRVSGDIVDVELAGRAGEPVVTRLVPGSFTLEQNYPNPFNPTTRIGFHLAEGGRWVLDIYNLGGQRVDGFEGLAGPGHQSVIWDATNMASGIYFYRLTVGRKSASRKAVLLK